MKRIINCFVQITFLFVFSCAKKSDIPTQPDNTLAVGVNSSSTRANYINNEINQFNSFLDTNTKAYKYNQMKISAFNLYRATVHLFYKDLYNGTIIIPSEWKTTSGINTWLSGDLHIQNYGFFENDNWKIKFDLNDFDESSVAPFYMDLIRYVATIHLMKNEVGFNFSDSEIYNMCKYFLETYKSALSASSVEFTESNLSGFVKSIMQKVKNDNSVTTLLDKWTKISSGKRIFNLSNSDLQACSITEISAFWQSYKNSISSFVASQNSNYFKVKDVAIRLNSGLGSLGVKKYYVLIEGKTSSNSDDIILEVKEERTPSMYFNPAISQISFTYQADRVKLAAKSLLKNLENHTGVMIASSKSYFVRMISAYKYGFEAKDFKSKSDLENFVKYCAQAIAFAHTRAASESHANSSFASATIKAIDVWKNFKDNLINLSKEYAKQVNADYNAFK